MPSLPKPLTKKLPHSVFGLLGLQFLLGISSNLFQEIPKGLERYSVYWHLGFTLIHAWVGVTLVTLGVIWLVNVTRRKLSARVHWASVLGFVFLVVAFTCGVLFVETGSDWLSLCMAVGFVGAFSCYALLAFGPAFE